MANQEVIPKLRRSTHLRTVATWEHVSRQNTSILQMGRGVVFPTEIWLQITEFLSRRDLKYLALVSKFFRRLCIPSLSHNVRLLRRHIEEREHPPKWLAGARRLKLRDESFSSIVVDSKLARYKGINVLRSSLSVLSLVNIRLPRKFYYYLLMIPAIRDLELSGVTIDDSNTPPTSPLSSSSIFNFDWFRKKNEDVPVAIPDNLYALKLESLRVHDLDTGLLAAVLGKNTLFKLSMESPCQDLRILRIMPLLQNVTSLTLSWETREVRFPMMLFPRLQYLDILHAHVSAFLRRSHRVATLKLREFSSSTFERLTKRAPPASDLGTMLAPAIGPNPRLEPTFKGITALHISIHGITHDWLTRLLSTVTYYPHVKDFSVQADLMETSSSEHAFQFSINLLYQYQGDTGPLERLCFAFGFLESLEIDCRRKREAGVCEWDVRVTNTRVLERWVLVANKLTSRETGDVYYPRSVGYEW